MKNTFLILFIVIISLTIISCDDVKEKTKNSINKSGETIGKTTTEFIEGVGEGINQTFSVDIQISKELSNKGMQTGAYSIEESASGVPNIFTLYLIFNQNFKEKILMKAYDKNDLEIGRVKTEVNGKKNEADYYDFIFNTRTKLKNNGRLVIELDK